MAHFGLPEKAISLVVDTLKPEAQQIQRALSDKANQVVTLDTQVNNQKQAVYLFNYPVDEGRFLAVKQQDTTAKCVIYNAPEDDAIAFWALDKGFDGYVSDKQDLDAQLKGIISVLKNELWFKRALLSKMIKLRANGSVFSHQTKDTQLSSLSRRELDVLKLLIKGKSNQCIASSLFVSVPTVKTHVSNILKKLGVSRRVELVHRSAELSALLQ